MKLTIELIPTSTWKVNLRSILKPKMWDILRKECYEKANFHCEICGGQGYFGKGKIKVECHEIWSFDESSHIQKLDGLIALCPLCHMCKHPGFHMMRGKEDQIKTHLQRVNKIPLSKVNQYLGEQFALHRHRSQFEWDLDLTWLNTKGFNFPVAPKTQE